MDPHLRIDGKYELIVESKDASNNKSGDFAYRISFEVINQSSITEVMNYPNPFSTSTRFVFTLTGSVVPDYFKIRIMTVSGKVVREITQDQLGAIRIGRNITEYAWDGRDEFGDRLANGIYFYKVFTGIAGETIEKKETQADQYFKKGFGKMVLIGN
jgi:flagellar hook assembly protein FlgD